MPVHRFLTVSILITVGFVKRKYKISPRTKFHFIQNQNPAPGKGMHRFQNSGTYIINPPSACMRTGDLERFFEGLF